MLNKKTIFIALIGIACAFLAMAVISQQSKAPQRNVNMATTPMLLSDVDMPQYVALPKFEEITAMEVSNTDREKYEKQAFDEIVRTAKQLKAVTGPCTVVLDYTVSKDNEFVDKQSGVYYYITYDPDTMPESLLKAFQGAQVGDVITANNTQFMDYGVCDLQATIKAIYDMPYPFTDEYMTKYTQYKSFDDMVDFFYRMDNRASKDEQRQKIVDSLIDTAIKKSTFVKIPESLIQLEIDYRRGEGESIEYDEAKDTLKKIFFIAAVIEQEKIAKSKQMDDRVSNYMRTNGLELDGYAMERLRYLLYEDDVTNYIYKKMNITNEDLNAEEVYEPMPEISTEALSEEEQLINDLINQVG